MRVKVFEANTIEYLEGLINSYLVQFFNAEVSDIKFQTSLNENELRYSALVIIMD